MNDAQLKGLWHNPAARAMVPWIDAARIAVAPLVSAAAIALAAQVRIPLPGTPVPMTLQALAVLLVGFFLAPRTAGLSVGLYLLAGAAGLPAFAPGSSGLLGPTGGYLVGFAGAAVVVGLLKSPTGGWWRNLLAAVAGLALVLASGVGWLALWFDGLVAIHWGLAPFVGKAAIEAGLAATLASNIHRARRSRFTGFWGNR